MSFPLAYLLTLAVEVPAVVGAAAAMGLGRWPRTLVAAVVASAMTVPVLWFVLVPVLEPRLGWLTAVLIGEGAVVAVEAGLYSLWLHCDLAPAIALSLGANGLSVLAGLVLVGGAG